MTGENVQQSHLARLAVWNRLFHNQHVSLEELDTRSLCGDETSADERAAYVALRACVAISETARRTICAAFRVVILYWFSNVGKPRGGERELLQPQNTAFHLGEAIGTRLSWDEAVALMGRKPVDYSAYLWLLDALRAEYTRQWSIVFPGEPSRSIELLWGPIHDTDHAQRWGPAMEPSPKRRRPKPGVSPTQK